MHTPFIREVCLIISKARAISCHLPLPQGHCCSFVRVCFYGVLFKDKNTHPPSSFIVSEVRCPHHSPGFCILPGYPSCPVIRLFPSKWSCMFCCQCGRNTFTVHFLLNGSLLQGPYRKVVCKSCSSKTNPGVWWCWESVCPVYDKLWLLLSVYWPSYHWSAI